MGSEVWSGEWGVRYGVRSEVWSGEWGVRYGVGSEE